LDLGVDGANDKRVDMDTSEFFKSTRISKVSNLVEIDNKVGGGD
jgi:hypothetical protein